MSESPEGFNPEQKEEEQKSPIFIIYRDNDLFQKQIPEMVKILSAMGRQVEVQGFSRETTEKEIKKWYEENQSELEGKEIISDRTAGIPQDMEKNMISAGTKKVGNIDNLLSGAMSKVLLGDSYDKLENSGNILSDGFIKTDTHRTPEKEVEEFFTAVVKRILDNPKNIPNKVIIFPDHIMDHISEFDGGMYYDEVKNLSADERQERRKEATMMLIKKVKEWLEAGGLDVKKIKIGEDINRLEEFDKQNNWIIMDRHIRNRKEEVKLAKYLEIPAGNFYETARERGLLDYTDEEFTKAFSNILEEKFLDKK